MTAIARWMIPLAICSSIAAQDVLWSDGRLNGVYRLTDTNNDGVYDPALNEVYDYLVHRENGDSIRDMVFLDAATTGGAPVLYVMTQRFVPGQGQPNGNLILSGWDSNNDGLLDGDTEMTLALDITAAVADPDARIGAMEYAGNGVFYICNDRGLSEGLYRCEDMNGDLDFDDAGEFVAVISEGSAIAIANAPLSGAPTLDPEAIQSLEWDPSWNNGRLLIEEETADAVIALEDINADGDFDDVGECYLFCQLLNSAATGPDLHPDVVAGLIPAASEVRDIEVDQFSGVNSQYYMCSTTTGSTFGSAALIYRGVDLNADGDVNDAGETTVFFDGSLNSLGATIGYNFNVAIDVFGPFVMLMTEFDGATEDDERLLRLLDLNADGDVDDAGEATVAWMQGFDRVPYELIAIPPGLLPALPGGTPSAISVFGSETCTSSAGTVHRLRPSGQPVPGLTVTMETRGAAIGASGVMHIGFAEQNPGIPIDAGQTCLLSTLPVASVPFLTDATGMAQIGVQVPTSPGIFGIPVHWQSVVADLGINPFNVTLSGGIRTDIGAFGYTPDPLSPN